ncbi:protein DMR6-LIKE OXYGENASE 2-like [Vigna unguiculata]|uniref:Isopenicillin N synthase-like n=1 Tax=Vigna unguiculata TaxID=3917 RepID=A0A4D6LMZ4_VIGUN|nr:protein DMR6-LIKE OXYGENASE 2-like [Vigna unguiculata]QCD89404.1 Isopenicillin N synthase-like [Vigna unguiculata]
MGNIDLDPAFIQSTEHRPTPKVVEVNEIPVIDLSESRDESSIISDIGKACEEWGFFQIVNHGVSSELCREVEIEAKKFFGLELEEKRKVKRDEVNSMGYHDGEHTKNVRDWKEVFDYLVEDNAQVPSSYEPDDKDLRTLTNQWPQHSPHFRKIMEEYAREVEKLSYKLLGWILSSLGLAGDKFHGCFKNQLSMVRLNYYPPCPFPHLALGVGRHKDSSAFTVLAQDEVGGLQVKRKSDGEWIPVRPFPNAYIINVGDIVQVWSNDKYESVEHRVVVNTTKERFSVPFFFFPSHHVNVKPVEELVSEETPAKFREYNYGKFFANRNRSDFKKRDVENIQIDHFRI